MLNKHEAYFQVVNLIRAAESAGFNYQGKAQQQALDNAKTVGLTGLEIHYAILIGQHLGKRDRIPALTHQRRHIANQA